MVLENREKKSGMENSGMEMDTAKTFPHSIFIIFPHLISVNILKKK